ncbi:Histone acetyltransferase HPA2/related acetyltransferase [Hahella chejuensis KCTC 2396]|uniref:Histone acetyltransferase HPA2/related acetyltransferase n=1 Tax=Hahella chejuensis (strain KCTC 2396) TaxID=349521 RepID=Q2SJZ3_HAHCH|nr:GNAT family N-acetyltransferase [Hahella chejuensis]ABC29031.1 Histone acetyltransferase HPA2/related acetyltransferase [Hahella chejuensis KCTC 2396]
MEIREALEADFEQIWRIFHSVVVAGETYAYAPDTSKEEAYELWLRQPQKTYVAVEGDTVLGTYYLKQNQLGLGSHVSNCGYMVAESARGKGVAAALCEHSQAMAKRYGYKAMQYNFVVSTNEVAVNLWKKLGYEIAGRLPKAFRHSKLGLVDALVMYKWLGD